MSRENGDVFLAVAQRRHEERNYIQAIKQILTKGAARDFLLEVFGGGGEDASIHGEGLAGAYRLEALFFEDAQNFGLRAQAHVSDFVEEERAAVGFLEFSYFVIRRAGEAAFHVAEQLGFNQLLGNGGAADFHNKAFAPQAGRVQGASRKLLARAALAMVQTPA